GATAEQRARFGEPDGCGFDREGDLWVTLIFANRVVAITPSGRLETVIHDPTGEVMAWPTNVAWGGPDLRDLYIGSLRRDYIVRARSPVAGLPLAHQR
ncbi:MAG: SMP-30/gluconolactonase/LRE family protein, partial [Dehalococcoidia bacterium]|nr:SMP-30/gluconolactonase/LRE family protein [Dehalococcoidia bacterium]